MDGEGCFALSFRRDIRNERGKRSGKKPVYFYWKAQFVIVLRNDDNQLLEKIKNSLNCGSITFTRNNVRYQVSNLDDLKDKIIPFFLKYHLHGKKQKDFILWIEAIDILNKYKIKRGNINRRPNERGFYKVQWKEKDLRRLTEIQQKMSIYKSNKAGKQKWIGKTEHVGRGDIKS